jgi:rubrerythrin
MNNFKNTDEILDFAIKAEQAAVDFYTELSQRMANEEMRDVFQEFAMEEVKHKARLTKIQQEQIFNMSVENIADLKISDYTVSAQPHPDMSYQDALILAMNREKAAFKLYTKLASKVESNDLKNLFLSLAQEESKHKLRFELEYDEYILREN